MSAFIKAMTLSRTSLTIGATFLIGIVLGGLGLFACSTKRAGDITNTPQSLTAVLPPPSIDIIQYGKLETAAFALG